MKRRIAIALGRLAGGGRGVARLVGGIVAIVAIVVAASTAGAQKDLAIPAPQGLVNDFAAVIPADQARQIEAIAQFVRDRSGGEIAVVTLRDIAGRDPGDVALRIGREWKVGANAAIGDAKRNTGIVVLLVPKESSSDGHGHVSVQVGNGAEGFVPDAVAGDIRREATPQFQRGDYGGGLLLITTRLAQRYAAEFGFSLDSMGIGPVPRGADDGSRGPQGFPPAAAIIVFVVIVLLLTRGGRSGCLWFLLGQVLGSAGRRGGWGGGGFGGGFGGFGGGGGGGGGFGGFGGGGGFSGGGSSGSF